MRPKELQKKLHINADRIKFYKKQDVFTPENPTSGNRATNYTENDYEALKVLEVLTKSGFTVGDIKKMQGEEKTLAEVAKTRIADIVADIERKKNALLMLNTMLDDNAEFETLDTDHYWKVIHGKETAGEAFINIEDMYGYQAVSLIRDIECPHCGESFEVDLEDYLLGTNSYESENGMGPDCLFEFDSEENHECPECGRKVNIRGWIREYPMGAYDSEEINVDVIDEEEE